MSNLLENFFRKVSQLILDQPHQSGPKLFGSGKAKPPPVSLQAGVSVNRNGNGKETIAVH
jgi:hypothetical protein